MWYIKHKRRGDILNNSLGNFIKSTREQLKLSLRELGEKADISYSYLSQIENGVDKRTGKPIRPTVEFLNKLSKGLGVDVTNLVSLAIADGNGVIFQNQINSEVSLKKSNPKLDMLFRSVMELPEDVQDEIGDVVSVMIARRKAKQNGENGPK